MKFSPPSPLRESDYEAIEAAVTESERGRWFLAEYARRNRNADTDMLLEAIEKLGRSLDRDSGSAPSLDGIRLDIVDMMEAIERTKVEIAQINSENTESNKFEQASAELDAIVSQTEHATQEILTGAEHIQEAAWTLREQGFDDKICDDLDKHATDIYTACSFQDLTGQRIQKVVHVLGYVESRLTAMINIWGMDGAEIQEKASATGDDARPDAHLLNGPQDNGVDQNMIDRVMQGEIVDAEDIMAVDLSEQEDPVESLDVEATDVETVDVEANDESGPGADADASPNEDQSILETLVTPDLDEIEALPSEEANFKVDEIRMTDPADDGLTDFDFDDDDPTADMTIGERQAMFS